MSAAGTITLSFVPRAGVEGPALYAIEVIQQPDPSHRLRRSANDEPARTDVDTVDAVDGVLTVMANVPMAAMSALVSLLVLAIITNWRRAAQTVATDPNISEASEPKAEIKRPGAKPQLQRGGSKITVNRSFPSV